MIHNLLNVKIILVLLSLQLFTKVAITQQADIPFIDKQPLRFKSVTVRDGLSQNWVRCIFQDNQGFLWFGTSDGLNRYDGYDVDIYSLGNVNINAIGQKNDKALWICNDLGVFIYDSRTNSIVPFHHLKGYTVLCFVQEQDSTVWFGSNTGLHRYIPSEDTVLTYTANGENSSGLFSNYINTIFKDAENTLWVGTNAGLNKYNKARDSFENVNLTQPLPAYDVMSICEDKKQRLWVGTAKNGLYVADKNKTDKPFQKIVDGPVMDVLADSRNLLWISMSSGGGILRINLDEFNSGSKPAIEKITRDLTHPFSLSDNSIFGIYEDRFNDIWIGTFSGGVNYYSYRNKKFMHVSEGINSLLKNNIVNAILEDNRFLWIGTEGGLERYDKLTAQTKIFSYDAEDPVSIASNPVYSLFKDHRGNLWVGTWTGGLSLYNSRSETFKRYTPDVKPGSLSSENVFAIFEDSGNELWIGTVSGGLNLFDYKSETFTTYKHDPKDPGSLYSDIIHDIKETADGRLLVAAYGSIDIFDRSLKKFTHYPMSSLFPDSLTSRYVVTIFIDSKKRIWLGTNDGLILFNENRARTYIYSKQHGLAGNTIQGIVEDKKGNLWITTNSGLSRFNGALQNPLKPDFTNFDESDGLSGNDFKKRAIYQNTSGLIYLGSSQGFSYFHPDSIKINNHIPEVVLADIRLLKNPESNDILSGKNINALQKIELNYHNSDFEISFAALNYLNPQKNKYKYILSGYDRNWIPADENRKATYKNLRPGNYTFMVLGSNNDGVWNPVPRQIQIIIIPPFWQTLWFQGLAAIAFLGLLVLIFQWRLYSVKKDKKMLEKVVAERTSELQKVNDQLEDQSEELLTQNEELRQSQEELSIYKDQLEELVLIRTEELEKAKTKAEESDRLKSMFLANMSHEIRTPLNAIAGFSSLLNEPSTDESDKASYHQIIRSNIESLLRLINDILDLSTIEANQIKIKKTPFAPADVFFDMYRQFLPEVHNEVKLLLKVDEDLRKIVLNSDEFRFRQIISNLISNAIKFTEKGSIETGFFSHGNSSIICYVKDTGIGISPEEQKMIFNHFTKVENNNKLFRGAGLGLAICKQLTELMGGKIWVESEPGKGSTFYFTHPV